MELSLENKMLDAIKAKNLNLVSRLLSKGANPNKIVRNGMTCLGQAVVMNLTKIAKLLIAESHSDNQVSSDNDENDHALKNRKKEASIIPLKKELDMLSIYTKYTTDRAEKEAQCKSSHELDYGSGSSSEDSKVQSPQSDLEWDENIGKVAANTKKDNLTIDMYQWYATILETTGAAVMAASDFTYGIDQEDAFGNTALSYACNENHHNLEIFKALVKAGCKIDAPGSGTGRTVLYSACGKNRLEFLKVLLAAGCDVNRMCDTTTTALHIAAGQSLAMTTMIVDHGALLEFRDGWDRTALFKAAARGRTDIVEFLLSRGARLNIQDAEGHTPLCLAVRYNRLETVALLLESGARITHFQCMLHHAVRKVHYEMARLLASRRCGLNVPNHLGDTPLFVALETHGRDKFVKLLLNKGANVNICNNTSGLSLLHMAVDVIGEPEEFEDFLNILLDYGLEIDMQNINGSTALNRAILLQRNLTAMVLLRYGADPNIYDLRRDVPGNLLLASYRKKNKLANLLIKAGHNTIELTAGEDLNFPEWVAEMFMNPLSLNDICRIRIRNMRIRKNLRDFVRDLPIPKEMKNFLMMDEFSLMNIGISYYDC